MISNGSFENGFNFVSVGHVGKGWGFFTNGGAAVYGFYDEQWPPVVADGSHGQLIEINSKGILPADPDRYAGIYQLVKGLYPGATYELSLRGMLRGTGPEDDPYRYEAQWGFNPGFDTRWEVVGNWSGMNLGEIFPRTEPGALGGFSTRFVAPSDTVVIFLRGWKKWGITDEEMDFNLDAISLRSCQPPTVVHPDKPHKPHKPYYPLPTLPGSECTYMVKPGDTLGTIAKHHWVSVQDLVRANGIHNPNLIYVGQKLYLPNCTVKSAPPQPHGYHPPAYEAALPEPRHHAVKPGETLSGICAQYGLDPHAVIAANNIADPNFIYVGQVIVIP
jgi:LysM repeat protein